MFLRIHWLAPVPCIILIAIVTFQCWSPFQPGLQIKKMSFGAFHFEVVGRVQGVYFRKHTVDKARALGLVGWVANSQRGTVMGECQGGLQQLQQMKEWLSTEGSPHSHIEECLFREERQLNELQFPLFERRPNVP